MKLVVGVAWAVCIAALLAMWLAGTLALLAPEQFDVYGTTTTTEAP